MTIDEAYSMIKAMPLDEKHALLSRLIEDVDLEEGAPHTDAEQGWAREIQDRVAAYDRGELPAYSADDVVRDLRDSLGRGSGQ